MCLWNALWLGLHVRVPRNTHCAASQLLPGANTTYREPKRVACFKHRLHTVPFTSSACLPPDIQNQMHERPKYCKQRRGTSWTQLSLREWTVNRTASGHRSHNQQVNADMRATTHNEVQYSIIRLPLSQICTAGTYRPAIRGTAARHLPTTVHQLNKQLAFYGTRGLLQSSLKPFLSLMNPVHTITPYFDTIHLILICRYSSQLSQVVYSSLLRLKIKYCTYFSSLPCMLHVQSTPSRPISLQSILFSYAGTPSSPK
jgi:hypothetical protein